MIFIMARSFKEAIQHRRTHYGIGNNSPISDNEIHEIIKTAVTHVPSAFNSQSTRIVLLLGESHKKLWEIGLSGNFWLVSFKISYLCLPLFYETQTTPSCHPSGCAYRQL